MRCSQFFARRDRHSLAESERGILMDEMDRPGGAEADMDGMDRPGGAGVAMEEDRPSRSTAACLLSSFLRGGRAIPAILEALEALCA